MNQQLVHTVIADRCHRSPFTVRWALRPVASEQTVGQESTLVAPSASTRKVAVLATALRLVHQGRLSLDQPVVIDERYRTEVQTGFFQNLHAQPAVTLHDALMAMTIISDNLSTAHVLDLVGLEEVNRLCADLGMRHTRHTHAIIPRLPADHPPTATNHTTAADQATLLSSLVDQATGAATALDCDQHLATLALDMLSRQMYRDGLPALLPPGTRVANKTGLGYRDVSDIGVVYRAGEPAFVLAVYVDDVPATIADASPGVTAARTLIAQIARDAWDHCTGSPLPDPAPAQL